MGMGMEDSLEFRLGEWGERQAEKYLTGKGFRLIRRNFRVREGEIDLIMRGQGEIVFVEVKTRVSTDFGSPEESITEQKLGRMVQAAQMFLEQEEWQEDDWRMDMVAIECTSAREILRMEHYENIGTINR